MWVMTLFPPYSQLGPFADMLILLFSQASQTFDFKFTSNICPSSFGILINPQY